MENGNIKADVLYLIEILHQTTTFEPKTREELGCILLKFYIKPQRISCAYWAASCCILLKFYIKPQHLDGKRAMDICCILLKFYIKPQR